MPLCALEFRAFALCPQSPLFSLPLVLLQSSHISLGLHRFKFTGMLLPTPPARPGTPQTEMSCRGSTDTRAWLSAPFEDSWQFSVCPDMSPSPPTLPTTQARAKHVYLTSGIQIHNQDGVRVSRRVPPESSRSVALRVGFRVHRFR